MAEPVPMPSETQEERVREWTLKVCKCGGAFIVLNTLTHDQRNCEGGSYTPVPVLSKEDVARVLGELAESMDGFIANPLDDKMALAFEANVASLREAASSLGISLPTPGDAG